MAEPPLNREVSKTCKKKAGTMADSIYTARRPTHPHMARRPTHPHTARRSSMTYKARRPTTGGALYLGWRWSRATRCRGHLRLQRGAGTTAGTNGEGHGRRPRLLLLPSPSPSPSPSPPFSFFLLPSPLLHLPSLLYSPAPPLLHSGGLGAGGSRAGHHRRRSGAGCCGGDVWVLGIVRHNLLGNF